MNMRSELLHSAATAQPADPIFAALAEFKIAREAFHRVINAQDHSGEHTTAEKRTYNAADRREQRTVDKICRTVPTTVAGVHVLTQFVSEEHEDVLQTRDSLDAGNIEAALLSVSKAVTKLAKSEPAAVHPIIATTTDPIITAIAECDAAQAAMEAVRLKHHEAKKDIPQRFYDAVYRAEGKVFDMEPSTLAGLQTVCAYIVRHFEVWQDAAPNDFKRTIFEGVAHINAVPVVDPIFARIAEHDAAAVAELASCGKEEDIPLHICNARHATERKLFATTPATVEGMRALASHVLKYWPHFYDDVSEPLKPLLRGLADERAKTTTADPIYAAIAQHRSAAAAYMYACNVVIGPIVGEIPQELEDPVNAAGMKEREAIDALAKVRPTTTAGAVALSHHLTTHWAEEVANLRELEPKVLDALFEHASAPRAKRIKHTADPTYDAIAREWAAWLAYDDACEAEGDDDAEISRTLNTWCDAWQQLRETRPTTLAGMSAVFEYIDTVGDFIHEGVTDPDRRVEFLSVFTKGVVALNAGALNNPRIFDPEPPSHGALMESVRDRCRQEASERLVREAGPQITAE